MKGRAFFVLLIFLLLPGAVSVYGQLEGIELEELNPGNESSVDVSSQGPPPTSIEFAPSLDAPFFIEADKGSLLRVRYTFPEGFHQTKQEEMFTVSLPPSSPVRVSHVEYPEGVEEEGLVNYYGSAELEVTLRAKEDAQRGEYRIPLTASYQLCNEAGTCFSPEELTKEIEVRITGTPSGADTSAASGTSLFTLLQYLLFAFLGGILLNVMPCVLPVLSIRALNLVKQGNNKRREIFFGSLLYSGGIILSLTILASVVTILKFSGELVGWGFQFQNPGFVVFLSAVVFVFALSLFDVYVFQPPSMGGAVRKAGEKGYIGSFFNGIIAVLLATPCTAPLLGTALGFAFSQPPPIIFGMFILVGLGFAFPFLLIGIWPSAVQKLPKPGPWMNTFKELMGFVLLATVLYLLTILRHQVSPEGLLRVLLFLLILGFLLWIYGKMAKPTTERKRKWIILVILFLLTLSAADRILRFESPEEIASTTSIREGWETFEPEKLERYRREGKPVFVIFSAKWCTVCKLNERTVLHREAADRLFEERNIQVLYGDFTNEDPLIGKWIRSYGRAGVPVYAYYSPDNDTYQLLPEVLSLELLEKRLR